MPTEDIASRQGSRLSTITHHSHSCPRCGYDQSGLVAAWQSSCPLAGTCSECGLEFEWADVLNADRKPLRGFVEHERRGILGLRLLVAALRTFTWTWLPWRFWAKVRLHHPVRRSRWAVWFLLMIGSIHVLGTCAHVAARLILHQRTASMAAGTSDLVEYVLEAVAQPIAVIQATDDPSTGSTTLTNPFMWRVHWLFKEKGYLGGSVWMTFTVPMLAASFAFPLLLLILPDTRRIAKVRVVHLARAFVYSLSWVGALAVFRLFRCVVAIFEPPYSSIYRSPPRGWVWSLAPDGETLRDWRLHALAPMLLWLSVWWLACIWRGLRLPRPIFTWGVLLIAVMLAVMLAGTLTLIWSDGTVFF